MFITLSFLLMQGCQKEEIQHERNSVGRETILLNSGYLNQKEAFSTLSPNEKKNIWIDKLEHLLSLSLPIEHLNYIGALKAELVALDGHQSSQRIVEIGVSLANITPREDFLLMFASLVDYDFKNSFIGSESCSECISDMLSESQQGNQNLAKRKSCNCSWTCDSYSGVDSTSDCEETETGCGFLWLFRCRERIEP